MFLSVFVGVWTATSGIKERQSVTDAKIDIIQQQLIDNSKLKEAESRLDEANRRLLEKTIENLDKGVNSVNAQEKLNTIEINNLKDRIVNMGARK